MATSFEAVIRAELRARLREVLNERALGTTTPGSTSTTSPSSAGSGGAQRQQRQQQLEYAEILRAQMRAGEEARRLARERERQENLVEWWSPTSMALTPDRRGGMSPTRSKEQQRLVLLEQMERRRLARLAEEAAAAASEAMVDAAGMDRTFALVAEEVSLERDVTRLSARLNALRTIRVATESRRTRPMGAAEHASDEPLPVLSRNFVYVVVDRPAEVGEQEGRHPESPSVGRGVSVRHDDDEDTPTAAAVAAKARDSGPRPPRTSDHGVPVRQERESFLPSSSSEGDEDEAAQERATSAAKAALLRAQQRDDSDDEAGGRKNTPASSPRAGSRTSGKSSTPKSASNSRTKGGTEEEEDLSINSFLEAGHTSSAGGGQPDI